MSVGEPVQQTQLPDCTCQLCSKSVKGSPVSVSCIYCNNSCHVACIVNNFKAACEGSLNTGIQRLTEFLKFGNFQFVCRNCVDNKKSHVSEASSALQSSVSSRSQNMDLNEIQSTLQSVSDNVKQINMQIADLHKRIDSNLSSCALSSSTTTVVGNPGLSSKPSSYSAAVTSNVSEVVKSAIVETLRQQKVVERNENFVALHNMQEYGTDLSDVKELLEFIGCDIPVANAIRIGRLNKSPKKARILKVELLSKSDRNILLQASRFLKDDPSTAKIFITKWLQPVELKKLKSTQERCRLLNGKSPVMKSGRKPYVVISGKLFERTIDGLLRSVPDNIGNDIIDKKLSKDDHLGVRTTDKSSSPKNECGGSHVAPLAP